MSPNSHDNPPAPATAIRLRALQGQPLAEASTRDIVLATANAIAERQGIAVLLVAHTPDAVTITLATGRIEAIGFAAELRRLTNNWFAHKHPGESLWGERVEEGDEWKHA